LHGKEGLGGAVVALESHDGLAHVAEGPHGAQGTAVGQVLAGYSGHMVGDVVLG